MRTLRAQNPYLVPVRLSPAVQKMVLDIGHIYHSHSGGRGSSALEALLDSPADSAPRDEAFRTALLSALGALPNGSYPYTVLPRLLDPNTPPDVLKTLFDDLMNRSEEVKLRLLYAIADIPSHPLNELAVDGLRSSLKVDNQHDLARWEQAVNLQIARDERGMRPENCRMH